MTFYCFHSAPQVNVLSQAHHVHLKNTVINAANTVSNWLVSSALIDH